ncbi:MAG: hypothetical protein GY757_51680 [bacterium]|nr:hypothetical protein [bacterium]
MDTKNRLLFVLFFIVFLTTYSLSAAGDAGSLLKGPYLGQKPPGLIPEIFAPGIISTNEGEGCCLFDKEGTMLLLNCRRDGKRGVFIMEQKNGTWSQPKLAPFVSGSNYYDGDMTLSPDGKTLYMASSRPLKGKSGPKVKSNIWRVNLKNGQWQEPQPLPAPVNTPVHESYACIASNNVLYLFCRDRGGFGKSDLFTSRETAGTFSKLQNMGKTLNTPHHEWDPYIAPDENYLIYCSEKEDSLGEDDLYITFKKKDGSWSNPVNMGPKFNSPHSENRPWVTLDGKYFFFTSNKKNKVTGSFPPEKAPGNGSRDVYWVDAKILDSFRSKMKR